MCMLEKVDTSLMHSATQRNSICTFTKYETLHAPPLPNFVLNILKPAHNDLTT